MPSKTSRHRLPVGSSAILALLLATSAPASAASPEVAAPVTIDFMSGKLHESNYKEWLDWAIAEYGKMHPEVTVVASEPADYGIALKTAIASGQDVPDIIGLDSNPFQFELTKAGAFLNLSPFIAANPAFQEVAEHFNAVTPLTWQYEGNTYQAIVDGGPSVIYYWKDLFEQAGAAPPATVADLYALVPKFEAIGVDTMVSGLSSKALWQIDAWFWQLAANVDYEWVLAKQAENCAAAWEGDAVATQALDEFAKLYSEGVLRKQSPQENYDPDAKQAFYNKEAAMFYSAGSWLNGAIPPEELDNVGVLPFLPATADGKYSIESVADIILGILNVTPEQQDPAHQAAVVDFVMYLAGVDSQKKIWELGRGLPIDPEAVGTATSGTQRLLVDISNVMASPNFQAIFQNAQIPEVSSALGNGGLGLMLGSTTTEQVLTDIDAACATVQG